MGLGYLHCRRRPGSPSSRRCLGLGRNPPPATAKKSELRRLGSGHALEFASAAYPGANITALSMPNESAPWYQVRFYSRVGSPRVNGATTLYLSVIDGRILQRYDPTIAITIRSPVDGLYPLYAGSLGGTAGQLFPFGSGFLLLLLGMYRIRLWFARRRASSS